MDLIVALPRDNKKTRPSASSYSSRIQMVVGFMMEAKH